MTGQSLVSGFFGRCTGRWLLCALLLYTAQVSADLTEIRVQLKWHHQFQFAGYYAALAQGYYRDAGLAVTLLEAGDQHTPIDQLMLGRAQFAIADTGALIYRSTGVPLVALGAIFQTSPSVLLVREDEQITNLLQLRGRKVMLGGGYMNAELIAMLTNAGLAIDDIELMPRQTSLELLIRREVAAFNGYLSNEPYQLAALDIPFRVFAPNNYRVDFYGDILLTTEAFVAAHPEQVEAFWQATRKGWEYALAHPDELIELILRDYNPRGKSREHLQFEARTLTQLILPNVVPIGYMNRERWERIEQVFRSQGLLFGATHLDSFLYQPKTRSPLGAFVHAYRTQLGFGLALALGLGLLLHTFRLRARVRTATQELLQAKHRAEREARTDHLTELPNRRYFLEHLTRVIAQAERQQAPLALLSIDVDHFKLINDRHGHAMGDHALSLIARAIERHVRTGDLCARMGGEEFAIACPHTDAAQANILAERLRLDAAQTPLHIDGQTLFLTLSVGVANLAPGDELTALLKKADMALYEAKARGRNTVVAWEQLAT